MSFRDELEAVVAEIRTEALRRYEWENEALFSLDDSGTRIVPDGPMESDARQVLQTQLDTFISFIDALEAKFATFYELDPLDLTLLASRLGAGDVNDLGDLAGDALTTVAGRLHHADAHWVSPLVEDVVEDPNSPNYRYSYWAGPAATKFNNLFLAPFRGACERQVAYTRLLAMVARIIHDAVAATKDDLLAIARGCRDELRSYRERREFNTAGFFTVVGVVASAVALSPSLPISATTALGVTSIGSSFVSAAAGSEPDGRPEWVITGHDASEIVSCCFDEIVRMQSLLAEQDVPVAQLLRDLADADPGSLERPEVADDPGGFGLVDSTDQNVVVAEVQDIYRAGYVALPAAADDYDQAHRYLYMHEAPRSADLVFPFSFQPFTAARANLGATQIKTRDSLLDAGTALVRIASDYDWADAVSAEQFDQYRDSLPPASPPSDESGRPVRGPF